MTTRRRTFPIPATLVTLGLAAASLALVASPAGAVAMCRGMPVTHQAQAGVLLMTGDDDDVVLGSTGDDLIDTGLGNDIVCGRAGNDTITTGPGNDTISGGPDDDTISAGAGDDDVHGNRGSDTITGGPGDDLLFGDQDDDTITGGTGNDQLAGQPGDDTLTDAGGADTHIGGNGDDTITDLQGKNVLNGSAGADTIEGKGRLGGGGGPDTLTGSDGPDDIFGGGGQDTIEGGDGNDVIRGGPGYATIDGGHGDDLIDAGSGPPARRLTIDGGHDDDEIRAHGFGGVVNGAIGDDIVVGDGWLHGGTGDDVIWAGPAVGNRASGNNGHDAIVIENASSASGGAGNDLIQPANDQVRGARDLRGFEGHDTLVGSRVRFSGISGDGGDDWINVWGGERNFATGDEGDDYLYGSPFGRDVLDGGWGTDTCGGGYTYRPDLDTVFINKTDFVNDQIRFCEWYFPRDVVLGPDDRRAELQTRVDAVFGRTPRWAISAEALDQQAARTLELFGYAEDLSGPPPGRAPLVELSP